MRPIGAAIFLTGALALSTACGGPAEPPPSSAHRFVYVSPDPIGINPFLAMGQTGIEAAAVRHGAEARTLESQDPTTREENVRAAIDDGASLIAVLGFEFNDIIGDLAPRHPEVEFLIVDQCIASPPANVHCAVFREFEASFLIGAMAASLSRSGHVGVIGAADIPFLHRYTDGFAAGARHVRPEVEVAIRWVGGESPFADPVRAKEQALDLAADGVDHIFAAAAAGNLGIFEAAQQEGFFAFGLDVDQCPAAPEVIVDNLIKRVDLVMGEAVDAIIEGTASETLVFGLESGGLDLLALADEATASSPCLILRHPELRARIRELSRQIVAGEIGIADPMGLL